jgi:signal transduction histidine kinase
MKIVSRFAAAFFSITCVWLVATSWLAAARESERSAARIERDTRALGEVLRAAVTLAWSVGGEDAARRLAEAADVERENVDVSWSPGAPALQAPLLDRPGGAKLRLRVPVRIPEAAGGTLVLVHAVPSEGALLRAALAEELAAALALGLLTGALAWLLGTALIGKPLERVVSQARRVARGDLSVRLSETRHDEIGDLKRELNLMCDSLAAAGRRLEEESAKRVETLEQLRHLDRLRTVGTLASAVAHELGTPLNVVLLRAQTLVDEPGPGEDRADASRVIVGQVERMSRIVRQLLDFSRAEVRRTRPTSLRAVLDAAAALLGSLAKKNGVALTVTPGEDVTLSVDAGQLEQAITNLIVNGVHAMPEGGALEVALSVEEAQRPGAPGAPVRAARIDVKDSGVGISEGALARIFEPFYTTREEGSGTGLGLSVAGGIVEEHGGWLVALSEPGHGSTFSIYLPLEPE